MSGKFSEGFKAEAERLVLEQGREKLFRSIIPGSGNPRCWESPVLEIPGAGNNRSWEERFEDKY